MPDMIEKVTKGLECHKNGLCQIDDKTSCPYWECEKDCSKHLMTDALKLLKELKGLTLALEQANATINYLNEEKEKAISEIEERKAFNLKCDGQPEWLRKGIDVGLNTALDILKGKDGE